jgi:hypothetical protein
MDDLFIGSLKAASNAQVGENAGFDKSSLKAYVCESKLKRVIAMNHVEVLGYLEERFKISNPIRIRMDAPKDDVNKFTYEEFDVIETVKSKLTSLNSKKCLQLWNIYEEKGLKSLLNALQFLSPIQKI